MNNDDIIYELSFIDVQNVANQEFNRDLTKEELKKVKNLIGDYISWYDSILNCFLDLGINKGE